MHVDLTKRELRQRSNQLNAIMCEWDPIGVMSSPDAPRDEYHCLIGPTLTLLQSGATEEAIVSFLRKEIVEHFGLSPDHYDFLAVARRIRTWFDGDWRDPAEPVTIFVALLGEAVDVWRPVQARSLGGDLFRIIGVNADVSDETWQFPAGATVRCERKSYGDGGFEMTAVERV